MFNHVISAWDSPIRQKKKEAIQFHDRYPYRLFAKHVNSVCLRRNVGRKIGERLANVCLDIRLVQEKCIDTSCAENKCRKSDLQSSLIKFQLTSWRRISYLVRSMRVSFCVGHSRLKNIYERRLINSNNRYNWWWYIYINWELESRSICLIEGSMKYIIDV